MEDQVRLTEWRTRTTHQDAVADKVLSPARKALEFLGAERDLGKLSGPESRR
jgi:hypothetical protein